MGCFYLDIDNEIPMHRFILFVIFEFFAEKIVDFESDSIQIYMQTTTYCISMKSQEKAYSTLNMSLSFKQSVASKA